VQDAEKDAQESEANAKGQVGSTRSNRTEVPVGQDKPTEQTGAKQPGVRVQGSAKKTGRIC